MQSLTDAELVALTQEGNVSAFNSLAGRWHPTLHGFVTRTLGNPEEAQDVCQETLLKAYRNIRRLRDGRKFKAWIHHIALKVTNIEESLAKMKENGVKLINEEPVAGAHGTRIAFLHPKGTKGVMLELVEEGEEH